MKDVFTTKTFENKNHKNHIIFICDHAKNKIPLKYNNLGLTKKEIESHIAYDIGIEKFGIELTKKLKQTYIMSNFSRLVIDPNRSKSDLDLIVENPFGVKIPGNKNIKLKEKQNRIFNYYEKYHSKLLELVKKKTKIYEKIFLVSLHSFTKTCEKFDRGIEVGLLWNKNMNLLLPIQEKLKHEGVSFGRNYPYSGFHFNFTLDRLNNSFPFDNIAIEIRNDLICSKKGITKYVNIFSKIFRCFLNVK